MHSLERCWSPSEDGTRECLGSRPTVRQPVERLLHVQRVPGVSAQYGNVICGHVNNPELTPNYCYVAAARSAWLRLSDCEYPTGCEIR